MIKNSLQNSRNLHLKPPVAAFSIVEVRKFQNYANFGIDVEVVTGDEVPDYFHRNVNDVRKSASPYASYQTRSGKINHPIVKYQPPPEGGYGIKTNFLRNLSTRNKVLLAAGAGIAAGVGGVMFTRRRRTKNGKVVVEQVRKKQ